MEETFDIIIVGGGTSGSALASRLGNELKNHSILLIEAGGKNQDINHQILGERYSSFITAPEYNWGYKTIPQTNLQKRELDYSRGKGLGGSTSINFGVWTRGPSKDYDRWAVLVEDDAWKWENVSNRFKKIETYQQPPSEVTYYVSPASTAHGSNGPVEVGFPSILEAGVQEFLDIALASGRPKNLDVNSGNPVGVAVNALSAQNGRRVTSSDAYLSPVPSNLTILTDLMVERVIFDGEKAVGIEGAEKKIFARKDIILSAGAVDSPKILLLSGIGLKEELTKHKIPLVAELPIGKNLQDHIFTTFTVLRKAGSTDRPAFYSNPDTVKFAREQWLKDRTGPLSILQCAHCICFFKLDRVFQSKEFQHLEESTQKHILAETVPTYEFLSHVFQDPKIPVTDDHITFVIAPMNPQSLGSVTLRSTDPKDSALIDPNFLNHPYDRRVAIESIRDALEILDDPEFSKDTLSFADGPRGRSDEELLEYMQSTGSSMWHASGTVKMGLASNPTTCVDKNFRVVGVQNLRVVDMSVAPVNVK
ncbi:MAG: hypothetical protein MMC33_000443 [Icmadophila ericetorum]|nr:hypothetical protein [Icmadophila ericetorum]